MSVQSVAFELDPPAVAVGPDAVAPRQSDRIVFGLDAGHFIELLLRAAVFETLTLGLYRFWLINDVRRFLWSHTSLEGERLEYAGHGHELFSGFLGAFLILLVILACIYGPAQVLGLGVPNAAIAPLFFFLRQVATFQARRYRLSRTVWRGVRFWMSGSTFTYALRAIAWDGVVVLTLGLALPWRTAALERYQLGNSGYGTLAGAFDGDALAFFKRVAWMWVPMAIPVGAFVYLALDVSALLDAPFAASTHEEILAAVFGPRGHILPLIAVLVAPFLALVLYAFFKAEEWRWWGNGVRFGDVDMHCSLSRSAMFALYLKATVVFTFAGLCLVILSLVAGLLALKIAGLSILDRSAMQAALAAFNDNHPYAVLGFLAGAYVTIVLTLGAVSRFFFDYSLWRAILPTLSFGRLAAVENVAAQGEPASAVGEGLLGLLRIGGL